MTNLCINIYNVINIFKTIFKGELKLKNKNIWFVLIILFFSSILFGINLIFAKKGDTVYIYYNSELYKTASLNEDQEININNTNTLVIENGCVYMKSATCPDKLCINQGKISDSSKNIICLPNKIVVKVDKASQIDAISQ